MRRFMSDNHSKASSFAGQLAKARLLKAHEKLILEAGEALVAYQSRDAADPEAKKLRQALHRHLDALDADPDVWNSMKELVGRGADETLADLMTYSLKRSREQVKVMVREADLLPQVLPQAEPDDGPEPEPTKTRKRGR